MPLRCDVKVTSATVTCTLNPHKSAFAGQLHQLGLTQAAMSFQGVASLLLLEYFTFPFNLEVFVEIVDSFPRTPGVRQI